MSSYVLDDAILRENRRSELARRFILHGVRTQLVSRMTGLTRGRLATVRRRLMVGDESRRRGPTRNPLNIFLGNSPRARSEGAALAALIAWFCAAVRPRHGPAEGAGSLELADRLCETYEAFRACCPATEVHLEELITLRSLIARGEVVEVSKCRRCRCLILIDRFSRDRECSHCSSAP